MGARCVIDYVELRSADGAASRKFLETAFGWGFVDYGPDYSAFEKDGPDGTGLDGGIDNTGPAGAPLVILKTADLPAALAAVTAAGAEITREPFDFPGGRRFQFREPGGAEMAVWAEPEA